METLRTSSYMIPVKLEKEENKYMLIHSYTGTIDIVSENLLKKIKSIAEGHDFSDSMLQTLLKRGYITTKTQEEEYAYVARMAMALQKKYDVLVTSFTWVVSYNCNFRCPYCFEGRSQKDSSKKLSFTKEQVDAAYAAQDKIQPNRKLRRNIITLYGGEPLLAENKEVINYIVQEGQKRGFKFAAVTNGYEIDQFLNLLGPDGIYRLQISIDGMKEYHNQRRVHYRDHNTFDKIIDNIQLALEKGASILVRMNSDEYNADQYTELKQYLEKKGFFKYPKFRLYLAILKDNEEVTVSDHERLDFLSIPSYIKKQQQQDQIQDTDIYKSIHDALINNRPIHLKSIGCAAQTNGYVLDPFGKIYPCWEVVGKNEYVEGVYSKNSVEWNEDIVRRWRYTNIGQKEPCKHCKYALICGGGCPFLQMKGKDPTCGITRQSFDIAVNKAYADFIHNV